MTQAPPAVSLEARFAEPALVLLGLPQNWIVLVKILPKENKLSCLPSGLAHTPGREVPEVFTGQILVPRNNTVF